MKRVLFVNEWLVRAGAQKYLFEIIKALDKNKFLAEVLCGLESRRKDLQRPEYYYFEMEALGIKMLPIIQNQLLPEKKNYHPIFNYVADVFQHRFNADIRKWFESQPRPIGNWVEKFAPELSKYDKIVFVDPMLFPKLQPYLIGREKDIFILITGGSHQFEDNYAGVLAHKDLTFVYFADEVKKDIEERLSKEVKLFKLPLCLEINYKPVFSQIENDTINIGIFTRISRNKHIEWFLIAFKELLGKLPKNFKVKLHLFGVLEDLTYYKILQSFIRFIYMDSYVIFQGHHEDLQRAVEDNNIHIGWFHSYDDSMGYAGIEIGLTGTAAFCWNLSEHPKEDKMKENTIKTFTTISEFVQANAQIIESDKLRREYCTSQVAYLKRNHDIQNFINEFEQLLLQQSN